MSSSYYLLPDRHLYKDSGLNEILNTEYIGISKIVRDDNMGNVENQYLAQLFAIENRIYELDQEICRIKYFIRLSEQDKGHKRLERILGCFPVYSDIFKATSNHTQFRERLEEKVGSLARLADGLPHAFRGKEPSTHEKFIGYFQGSGFIEQNLR